ncbi:hypothetical protein LguiB_004871 [Lonicera macranthoides]
MASIFQGVGATTALSSSNSFESKKFLVPSRISLSERKGGLFVVRSDARINNGSNQRSIKVDKLITNAVAVNNLSLSLSIYIYIYI